MKNKHISPTQRFYIRNDKSPIRSHHSGSTIQNSDHGMINYQNNKPEHQIPNKNSKPQSQTIATLRQELKNIKLQVTKLIEQGFVNVPISNDWLQSSGNMSASLTKSKSSQLTSQLMNNDYISQVQNKNYKKQYEFAISWEQFVKTKQQCQNLRILCSQKNKIESQLALKQKQLQKQIKALRKCNQQLTKCIQILQISLKQTNFQMKMCIEQNSLLHKEVNKVEYYKKTAQRESLRVLQLNSRMQEQINFRKAENNELIRIIQIKQLQAQQIKYDYEQQINSMEKQFRKILEQQRIKMKKAEQSFQSRQRRVRSTQNLHENSFFNFDIQNLQAQIQSLKKQLLNRQKIMLMMINDIKSMEAQLKTADVQHQQLIKCIKLITTLNQQIILNDMKNLAKKYKYCY